MVGASRDLAVLSPARLQINMEPRKEVPPNETDMVLGGLYRVWEAAPPPPTRPQENDRNLQRS